MHVFQAREPVGQRTQRIPKPVLKWKSIGRKTENQLAGQLQRLRFQLKPLNQAQGWMESQQNRKGLKRTSLPVGKQVDRKNQWLEGFRYWNFSKQSRVPIQRVVLQGFLVFLE